jgi:outer membrane lipoprotein-sorting protein/uncharacterized cupin superfamily protein
MTGSPQRTRVHPRERFAGSEKLFKLDHEFAALPNESTLHGGHMQKALYRHKTVTTAIFAFEPGGWIDEHQTDGELTIHVLSGKLFVRTDQNEYTLGPNDLLLLDPGVKHDLKAMEETKLLMTFVQIAPDGGTSTGTLYYARPDKMRLDYDPPSQLLIVANGWRLVYHDRRLEQVSQMFTRSTPLAFLLKDVVRLDGDVTVTGFERRGGEIGVALVQTEDPGQGQITLIFGEDPLELRRWTVTDAQGLTTHVVLEELETDVALDRSLFVWQNPDFYPELRRERR